MQGIYGGRVSASELAARPLPVNRHAFPLQREMPSRGFSRASRAP
jgi:hypothetical protein